MKIGMRNIKTGIAVMLCVLAGEFIVQNPMYAGIGCLVSIQDTFKGSVKFGFNRVKGTIIGGIIGYISLFMAQKNALVCGLGTMMTVYGCSSLKVNSGIVVACVTFLSINLGNLESTPFIYSAHRVIDTIIGVLIGIMVNFIGRPDYNMKCEMELEKIDKLLKQSIESKIIKNEKFKMDLINKNIISLEQNFIKLKDEMKITKEFVDVDYINDKLIKYREIESHMNSIDLLEKKLFIDTKNSEKLKEIFPSIIWQVDDESCPVYNYHLSKIVDVIYEN